MSNPPPQTQDMVPDVERFRALLQRVLGLDFDRRQDGTLARVLEAVSDGRRQAFLDALESAPALPMLGRLAVELTVTETYFFRSPDQFQALVERVLPECVAAGGPVELLSAGCASGEEPYTLAMLVRQSGMPQARVSACDVNPAMLARAERGRYSNWSLRELSPQLRARWFVHDRDAYVLDKSLMQLVQFEQRNLAQDDPAYWRPGRFDVIFCRNVLMYFTPVQAQAVVARLASSLRPGGYLFLGHAETLRGLSNDFELCHTHGCFYYQRKPGPATAPPPALRPIHVPQTQVGLDPGWADAIGRAAHRIGVLAAGSAAPPPLPAAAPADLQQALACLRAEQFDAVLQQLAHLPEHHAQDADVLLLRAVTLAQSGRCGEAQACCERILAGDTLHAGAQYVLGLCHESGGNLPAALEHYQNAAYLDPDFAMARLHTGLLLRRQGEHGGAQRELQRAAILLATEDPSRLLLFGGGFPREALLGMCRAHLAALERDA
jgi:chemotaxis protein methyltransferase CheR